MAGPSVRTGYDTDSVIRLFNEKNAWVDSVQKERLPQVKFTTLDTLFTRYSKEGFQAVKEPLHNYYNHIVDHMPSAEKREELARMKAVVARINDPDLQREVDYMEVLTLPDDTEEEQEYRLRQYERLARKYASVGDVEIEMRALRYNFLVLERKSRFAESFDYVRRIVALLERTPEEAYPDAYDNWYMMGKAYYKFHDYEQAIDYVRRSVIDTAKVFFFRSNMEARQLLAEYAREEGDLITSDTWYLSMLQSGDVVNGRCMYNCIAMEGLAGNLRQRGMYQEALRLCRAAWPLVQAKPIYNLIPEFSMNMGECLLALDDLPATAALIDTARLAIERSAATLRPARLSRFYPLASQYYARRGITSRSLAYADSARATDREIADKLNAMIILRNDQEQFHAQQELNDLKIARQQQTVRIALAATGVLCLLLFIILYLYRKKQKAYRELVRKSREWAETEPHLYTAHPEVDEEDRTIMNSIFDLLQTEAIHRDPDLTRESLAIRLGIHRNSISKAINHTQQKNFNQFINEYRLKEAIERLSDPNNDQTIYDIALACGFNSQPTFYRLFKSETGISPAFFRRNSQG